MHAFVSLVTSLPPTVSSIAVGNYVATSMCGRAWQRFARFCILAHLITGERLFDLDGSTVAFLYLVVPDAATDRP